ncbi:hypothetical protein N7492_010627 [Penicillium capsulatum]|uniref:Uncharacterized protein n=1 Tax=Penicillium capsulatum TaxID=69766 RepID=A0A9W9LFF5_9EURO|nr:hypothetical protein N7492_010627 [Penicillium capsulatum]KAJ6113126.1 hypothetical protein N7512_008450 [Penicillium capsulatum]
MPLAIQMIHVHFGTNFLSLLDSDDTTPLYTVKISRETPQMQFVTFHRSIDTEERDNEAGLCTASFKMTSMEVKLSLRGNVVPLRRPAMFSRSYSFESIALPRTTLLWEADGALTGDFKLRETNHGQVLCRFRNKMLSATELGSFELVGELARRLKEEILISGLSVLVMVQSLNLAGMVLIGSF